MTRVWLRAYRALALSRRLRPGPARAIAAADLAALVRGVSLRPRELRRRRAIGDADRPLVFIVGAPRSGSTLLSQLAVRCCDVGFVANAVARYWLTPVVGWDRFLRRGSLDRSRIPLASNLGATVGAESPHEFGYFFRTWMDFEASDELDAAALARCDWAELRGAFEGVAGRFQAAVVTKNMNAVSFQIPAFAAAMAQARFVHVTRDREATIGSILAARRSAHGDEHRWWSIRPAAWSAWRNLPPREQVERQVDTIRAAVGDAFAELPAQRRLELDLDEVRADPRAALLRFSGFIGVEPRLERLAADDVLAP